MIKHKIDTTDQALRLALEHSAWYDTQPQYWNELDVTEHHIWLTVGRIHTDGTHEAATMRREYHNNDCGPSWNVTPLL